MIDVLSEELLSLAQVAGMMPPGRGGKRCNLATVYRWTDTGVRGVVLESCQLGGRRVSSRQALARFSAALSAKTQGQAPAPPPANRQRRAAIDAAQKRLARAGC